MKSRAYRAVDVNRIEVAKLLHERGDAVVHVGLDVGKESILCVLRWSEEDFERPWRVRNPSAVAQLAELLSEVARGRRLIVALEPTGTYGDALRRWRKRKHWWTAPTDGGRGDGPLGRRTTAALPVGDQKCERKCVASASPKKKVP